jgi:hypothetical protein
MKHAAWFLGLAIGAATLTGCVERRYVIYTDPPGAVVLRNGQQLALATPVDDHYIYYGNYHFTIFKDGYETLQVDQKIPTPWYEYFPLDFVSENLLPWTIVDRREFHFNLEPVRVPNTDVLLREAQNLRNRGISLGGGSAGAPALPGPPPPDASAPPGSAGVAPSPPQGSPLPPPGS